MIVHDSRFHLDLGRNPQRVEPERSNRTPINSYAIANRLPVTFKPWIDDLKSRFFRYDVYMIPLNWRRLRAVLVFLERDHLERHAEDFGDFLSELFIFPNLVTRPPQPSPYYLLTQELRHKRPQTDDVRDRVTVPSFGQHPNAHNTLHLPTRWMQRAVKLFGQLLETFRIDRP